MPAFKKTKMKEGPEVLEWLKFYEMDSGMTCYTIFLTGTRELCAKSLIQLVRDISTPPQAIRPNLRVDPME